MWEDHHHQTDERLHFLDRQKALEAAMSDVNGSFGKGIVTRLGSAGGALVGGHSKLEFVCDMLICGFFRETFPSGCLALDYALGGGLPKGHIVEITDLTPTSVLLLTDALHWHSVVQLAVMYGNPEVMSGGLALKLLASLHLEIRNTGKIRSVSSSVSS
ncbi:unnamed protein product [Sphagnum jensenii]|uniref:RecA family profile 2 domain-containing protein n=1 Tax=Sphagnum jensenii TaxID=128206 RepID=A0ABP1A9N4_9BRYO